MPKLIPLGTKIHANCSDRSCETDWWIFHKLRIVVKKVKGEQPNRIILGKEWFFSDWLSVQNACCKASS